MKKYPVLSAAAFIIIIFLAGCGDKEAQREKINYTIAVVETTGQVPDSQILCFDKDLRCIEKVRVNYATLGNVFYNPIIYDHNVYMIPQGGSNVKDEKKVLEFNLDNMEIQNIYEINQLAMNSLCVDKNSVYTCNTLDGISYINRCDKETNQVLSKKLPQIYISKIIADDSFLYAFGTEKNEDGMKSFLFILDKNMELKEQIDITKYGTTHYKAVIYDNILYFSNARNSADQPDNTITAYDLARREFETLRLDEYFPLDIQKWGQFLLISHYDLVTQEGGGLSFYNLLNGEKKYYELDHEVIQIKLSGNELYMIGKNKLYKYRLSDRELKLEKAVDIQISREGNYLSGLFGP